MEPGETGKVVGGVLSARSARILDANLERLGVDLHDDAPVFRNRSGDRSPKNALAEDFRNVRAAVREASGARCST